MAVTTVAATVPACITGYRRAATTSGAALTHATSRCSHAGTGSTATSTQLARSTAAATPATTHGCRNLVCRSGPGTTPHSTTPLPVEGFGASGRRAGSPEDPVPGTDVTRRQNLAGPPSGGC